MLRILVLFLSIVGICSGSDLKCGQCVRTGVAAEGVYSSIHTTPIASTIINFSDFVKSSSAVAILPNNTLKVTYVPSSRGTDVISAEHEIPAIYKNEVMMEFEVFFDKDFEWVHGGKMHGLISGTPKTVSTGCVSQPKNGWSFRLMWRGDARIALYIYDQSRITNGQGCGNDMDSPKNTLTTNKWINIKMYMKLNTKGSAADGVAKLYIDNELVLHRENIQFRGVDTGATIDYATFCTFYGGHDHSWSPSKTTHASYRGAKLYKTDIFAS